MNFPSLYLSETSNEDGKFLATSSTSAGRSKVTCVPSEESLSEMQQRARDLLTASALIPVCRRYGLGYGWTHIQSKSM